jgi:hypothetical protein
VVWRLQPVAAAARGLQRHAAPARRLAPLLLLLRLLLRLLLLRLLLLRLRMRVQLVLHLLLLVGLLLRLLLRVLLLQLLHGHRLRLRRHAGGRAVVALVLRAVHRLQLRVVRAAGAHIGELRRHLLLQQLLLRQLQRGAVVQRQAGLRLAQALARQAVVHRQPAGGAEAQVGQAARRQRGGAHVVNVVVHK